MTRLLLFFCLFTLGCSEEKFTPIMCTTTGPGWSYGEHFNDVSARILLDSKGNYHLQTPTYSQLSPCGFLPEIFQEDNAAVILSGRIIKNEYMINHPAFIEIISLKRAE